MIAGVVTHRITPAVAQPVGAGDTVSDSLRVTAGWDIQRHQSHDATLTLVLSRPLRPGDGHLAVIVGRADLTALLEVRGTRAMLPLRRERLASGDVVVEAWLVTPDGHWHAAGEFALKRLTPTGFESATARPRLDVQSDGQLDAGASPAAPPLPRGGTYQDVTINGGIDGAMRRNGWDVTWQGLVAGASHEPARLRAAQIGPDAPMLDLASYTARVVRKGFALQAGHLALGGHRLLTSQFRTRGVAADVRAGRRVALTVGSTAGSEIVGWTDVLGLARPGHRLITGVLGVEAAPARPGLVRVELTALTGALQPLPAFTQQAVTDRESSRGLGVQLAAADPSQRIRLIAGVARSRFSNPRDPLLAGDSSIVAVRPETRAARFGELGVEAVRAATVGRLTANLSLAARHERVDPLYRSISAFVQADRRQDALEATGSLGALQVQASTSHGRDNLANVPSLLITRTRAHTVTAALPVAAVVNATAADWWWPALTLAWQGSTQRGDTTPPNGGFRAPFQIPNQGTASTAVSAAWQRTQWSATYRFNHSRVDNRQVDRARDDQSALANGVALAFTPSPAVSFAVDASRETQRSEGAGSRATNQRVATQVDVRPFRHTTFGGAASRTRTRDNLSTQRGSNLELRLEASQGFNAWTRPAGGSQGRAFLRWARTVADVQAEGATQPRMVQWALNGGVSMRLF